MEIWKDVKDFEGLYVVSNYGKIKSLKRTIKTNYFNRVNKVKERILKPDVTRHGYGLITLFKNNIRTRKLIHRLVAETFIPNLNNLDQVNHIDENKLNNKVSNLEWCTVKYNCEYSRTLCKATEKHIRKVDQYTIDHKYIKTFKSIAEASRATNIKAPSIINNCKEIYKTAGGYIWKYNNIKSK